MTVEGCECPFSLRDRIMGLALDFDRGHKTPKRIANELRKIADLIESNSFEVPEWLEGSSVK